MSLDKLSQRMSDFAKDNRIYIFMLTVVVVLNLLPGVPHKEKEEVSDEKKISKLVLKKEPFVTEERLREILEQKKFLGVLLTTTIFLSALAFALGSALSIRCLALKLSGRDLMATYGAPPDVNWHLLDIFRVVIIFYFFGYMLQLFEIIGLHLFGVEKPDEHIMAVINSTIMDILGFATVLYFVTKKYKRRLADLGISLKNFLRNIRVAVTAYITLLPVLSLILLVALSVLKLIRYEPPSIPIFELLYEESRPKLLLVLTILVSFIGPVAEETFFRGFAYPALRKRFGIKNGIILISFVFSLLHANLVGFFPIMALGILLAYLYEKTGSLIPSIAVHVIHNFIIVYFVHISKIIMVPAAGIYLR